MNQYVQQKPLYSLADETEVQCFILIVEKQNRLFLCWEIFLITENESPAYLHSRTVPQHGPLLCCSAEREGSLLPPSYLA